MPTDSVDLSVQPVEIAENTWWVGKRPPGQIFYANPYLRTFPNNNGQPFNLILDPGSSSDFAVVRSKVERVIRNVNRLSAVFINHQDPDVGSSVGLLLGRYTPNAHVLCTEDTWRLVHYYNIPRDRFVPLERFPSGFRVPSGEKLLPVPSPFCHFVGASMLYDPQTRVLFTGDLFGSLTDKDAEGLYADETDWAGMRAFHQIYMPTNRALKHAIANIRALDPAPLMIAPQHGRVIRGEWVAEFMRRVESLPVGVDILQDRNASPEELQAWTTVLHRVLDAAAGVLGPGADAMLVDDPDLRDHLEFDGNRIKITSLGRTTVERAVRLLCEKTPEEYANPIRYEAVFAAGELDLPTPQIDLEEDGGHHADVGAFMGHADA